VGFETSDDAAVYRLSDDTAFITTVDFITPPVDDPYWFGQISAANSLSDVYAMGGRPLTALNVVMFPSKKLDMGVLKEILRGGSEKVAEAGASMAGGHSVDDEEPKYGLAVTGVVHPGRVLTNCGAREGDGLVLTKPIGSGVLFNACRSGRLPFRDLEPLLPVIAGLNGAALEVALKYDIHACTDVTGFGISGHALEMALGSGRRVNLFYGKIPLLPNAVAMYGKGESTGSNVANRKITEGYFERRVQLSAKEEEILFDPQTSGGLLMALPMAEAEKMVREMRDAGVEHTVIIGEVTEDTGGVTVV